MPSGTDRTAAAVTVTIARDPALVRTVRLVAASVARRAGRDEEFVEEVRLAAGEACALFLGEEGARPGTSEGSPVAVTITIDDALSVDVSTPSVVSVEDHPDSDLDGIEPLQYPPGPMGGQLRAPGVQSLLKRLARNSSALNSPSTLNQALCLVTTREPLTDLADFQLLARERRPRALDHAAPLRAPVGNGIDFKVGQFGTYNGYEAYDTEIYTRPEIERVVRLAAEAAMGRNDVDTAIVRQRGGDRCRFGGTRDQLEIVSQPFDQAAGDERRAFQRIPEAAVGKRQAAEVRREIALTPLLHGGGQERDVRSGTVDAPAIRGFATAVELAVERRPEYAARVAALRDALLDRVSEVVPDAVLNGDEDCSLTHRLPGNAHIRFPGCEGDSLLMLLDARGIECSTGSACSAGVPQPSHVLLAMGADEVAARSALRFSLGHTTTEADVDRLVEAIAPVVERARAAGIASGFGLASSATAKVG